LGQELVFHEILVRHDLDAMLWFLLSTPFFLIGFSHSPTFPSRWLPFNRFEGIVIVIVIATDDTDSVTCR